MSLKRQSATAQIFVRKYPKTVMFGTVISLWVACGLLVVIILGKGEEPWAERGQFGDMFGAVNALFSGLAFGGIIITILLQKQELRLQRRELELTRQELKMTRVEFKKQNVTMKRQRFETTFFNMLSNHFEIFRNTSHHINGEQGIKAFKSFVADFRSPISAIVSFEHQHLPRYVESYNNLFNNISGNISLYIQSLGAIHQTILQAQFKDEVENRYLTVLESYISIPEKVFLFYYIALADPDNDDIKIAQLLYDIGFHGIENHLLDPSHYHLLEATGTSIR